MATVFAGRSALRSAVRSSASRISAGAKPRSTVAARSPFRIPAQNPLSFRIFRSPVEMSSVALESMLPFHTATASALLTSMLSNAPYSCGWTIDDS
ncbi:hypothetical protein L6452_30950 [Arctium lappa]|uniref:Uncharacterized protein n=1 Tax=Arctium lappa TaxID=4217 RepID=A0ACB8ZIM0_ARCLA|nr:hypothetical protein L6452_30950 [Arctium lappa]